MASRADRRRRQRQMQEQNRPVEIVGLIRTAIQDLKETKGITAREICDYIGYGSRMSEDKIKKQVKTALKRGLRYGILRVYRGRYFLPSGGELERANKIAERFSKLRTTAAAEPSARESLSPVGRKSKRRHRGRGKRRGGALPSRSDFRPSRRKPSHDNSPEKRQCAGAAGKLK